MAKWNVWQSTKNLRENSASTLGRQLRGLISGERTISYKNKQYDIAAQANATRDALMNLVGTNSWSVVESRITKVRNNKHGWYEIYIKVDGSTKRVVINMKEEEGYIEGPEGITDLFATVQ